jgi:hypothetical protein
MLVRMLMLVLMLMLMLMLMPMQVGECNNQGAASCFRAKGEYKHLCAYLKGTSGYCGGGHTKMDHDPAKHGT